MRNRFRFVASCTLVLVPLVLPLSSAAVAAEQTAPTHWSFRPIVRPRLPEVANTSWPRTEIDFFVLAALEARMWQPSPEAEPATLIRRISLDLTGLPPSWLEVEAFARDPASARTERLVERLLASPRYGERMAVPWLDLARYADSHGYHMDAHRDMWRWRDWVIDAMNRGMPFDQFTIEQLAGDLLASPTLSQRIASGFNRNHMINFEDGSIPEEFRTEYVADRTVTTATVWLGLTMACCRCHDHKYDPFTQQDFFRLFAFFNQVPEHGIDGDQGNAQPLIVAPLPEQARRQAALRSQLSELESALRRRERSAADEVASWERQFGRGRSQFKPPTSLIRLSLDGQITEWEPGRFRWTGQPRWLPGKYGQALLLDGRTYLELPGLLDDQTTATLAAWVFPTTQDDMTLVAKGRFDEHPRGFELALRGGFPTARIFSEPQGNELQVAGPAPLALHRWQHVLAVFDGTGAAAGLQVYVDGRRQKLRVVQDQLRQAVRTSAPLTLGGPRDRFRGLLDDVQIFDRVLTEVEVSAVAGRDPIGELIALPARQRTAEQVRELRQYYLRTFSADYPELLAQRDALRRELKQLAEQQPTVMVMQDLAQPRTTFLLGDGRYNHPLEEVAPATPAILPPMSPEWPRDRLGLARWLTDPANPLVARVAANRIWQEFFGQGIVATGDDFGTRGARPTHAELLDWLAAELVESDWDVKHLQRLITTSATYRQSACTPQQQRRRDPDNLWFARGPSKRLPAEAIRDSALQVAGLLVERLGGPSVFPYQPPGLWEEVSYDPKEFTAQSYVASRGADLYRRSLYTFWKRSVPPPNLAIFDAPARETCRVSRSRTNTPLQALVLMNDPTFVEAARGLAQRLMREAPGTISERARFAVRAALAREPSSQEQEILIQLWEAQNEHFLRFPEAAALLLAVGESTFDERLPPASLAAWTTVVCVLFQTNEFVTSP